MGGEKQNRITGFVVDDALRSDWIALYSAVSAHIAEQSKISRRVSEGDVLRSLVEAACAAFRHCDGLARPRLAATAIYPFEIGGRLDEEFRAHAAEDPAPYGKPSAAILPPGPALTPEAIKQMSAEANAGLKAHKPPSKV